MLFEFPEEVMFKTIIFYTEEALDKVPTDKTKVRIESPMPEPILISLNLNRSEHFLGNEELS